MISNTFSVFFLFLALLINKKTCTEVIPGNIPFNNLNVLNYFNQTTLTEKNNFTTFSTEISPKLICYYVITNKSIPLNAENLCTHINVAFFEIDEKTYSLKNSSKKISILQEVINLKKKDKDLKVLISIGGANCVGFSSIVQMHKTRKIFIKSVIQFLKKYNVDGVDLDWEWPVINGNAKEKIKFILLLQEFKKEFDRHKKKYIFSIDVSSSTPIIELSYYTAYIKDIVDFVNVMCYDYHFYSQWYSLTGHNAPMYSSVNNIFPILSSFNVNFSIHYWLSKSMPREKIILGIPTFGHTYRLLLPSKFNLNAPTKGFGSIGEKGYATYPEICNFIKQENTTVIFDKTSLVPYAFNYSEWVSFDNEYSLSAKANYVLEQKLGGAMIYSINYDDYLGECSENQEIFPLIKKVKSILFNKFEK